MNKTNNKPFFAHLVGIGGNGLSSLARIYAAKGYLVSGSDHDTSEFIIGLENLGVKIYSNHSMSNVSPNIDLLVYSSAVPTEHIEIVTANQMGKRVIPSPIAFSEMVNESFGITVAGSHGKSTTTAMIAWMLTELGQDPAFSIGAYSYNLGTNGRWGNGPFVFETDEYNGAISLVRPQVAVITNVDYDHPDIYPSLDEYKNIFNTYLENSAANGIIIYPAETTWLASSQSSKHSKIWNFGEFHLSPTWSFKNVEKLSNGITKYDLCYKSKFLRTVNLRIPGVHNILNSIAALAAIASIELSVEKASETLNEFSGIKSRLDVIGIYKKTLIINDFASHPLEASAAIKAARQFNPRRLRCVYFPNSYHKNELFASYLKSSFMEADEVLVTNLKGIDDYGEIVVRDTKYVADNILQEHSNVMHLKNFEMAAEYLINTILPGDLILTLGPWIPNPITEILIENFSRDMDFFKGLIPEKWY